MLPYYARKIVLDNISISDNFIEENVFGLGEKTDAVIAEYKPDGNSEPLKLMVVKYPDDLLAAAALRYTLKAWRTWGEEEFTSGAIRSFQSKTHRYTSFMQQGDILCAVFFAESRVYAEGLLNDVMELL